MALVEHLQNEELELEFEAFSAAFIEKLKASRRVREIDHVERPTSDIFRETMEAFGHPNLGDPFVERAMRVLYAHSEAHWTPVPHLHNVIEELQAGGVRLGLISNAGDAGNVLRLIDKAELSSIFDPILISAAVGIRKPAPAIFRRVLHVWDLPADEVVMIGDRLKEDISGARAVGMHQIWVKAYAEPGQERSGQIEPEAIAEDLASVPALMVSMNAPSKQ
jgi:putative hydrolase of the HAD superfamily